MVAYQNSADGIDKSKQIVKSTLRKRPYAEPRSAFPDRNKGGVPVCRKDVPIHQPGQALGKYQRPISAARSKGHSPGTGNF